MSTARSIASAPEDTERASRARVGAWAVREVASYHLDRVATSLVDAGVPLMVLKGMWLQRYAYLEPDERPFADLDLLVPRAQLSAVEGMLGSLGYRLLLADPGGAARLYVSSGGFQVDLHVELFPDGLFRLRGSEMLARGQRDARLASVPLLIPDPYDGFAHLVGHFAKGRHGARDAKLLRDFEEVGRAFRLCPERAARHLVSTGMRRAGLYALQFDADPRSFAAQVCRALPPDAFGRRWVRALGSPRPLSEPQRLRDRVFPFALEHSIGRGLSACARRTRSLLDEGGARRLVAAKASPLHQGAS